MAKVLLLRSSDGKVLVAPTWDKRRTGRTRPLETGVPSRVLERVVQFWTKHALAKVSGEPRESIAAWDADFLRRLDHDGLKMEVAAAVRQLRLNDGLSELLSDFAQVGRPAVAVFCAWHARAATRPDAVAAARAALEVAWSAALDADPAARAALALAWSAAGADPATARSDPVRAWCATHARADARSDHGAASRARGRQQAEEEGYACHHRKHPMGMTRPASADGRFSASRVVIQTSSFFSTRSEGTTGAKLQTSEAYSCCIKEDSCLNIRHWYFS